MAVDTNHNRVDPQGPTKTDQPAPVFFPPLLQHRRVSHPNHVHLPYYFFPYFYHHPYYWSYLHYRQMARTTRSASAVERDRAKVNPPRPPNAWILYRSYHFNLIRQSSERMSQAAVSKVISTMWRNESEDVKRHFEQQAETKKAEHQELYPDYRFQPRRKQVKLSRKKSKGSESTLLDEEVDVDSHPTELPVLPPVPFMPQPLPHPQHFLPPGHPHNIPYPYMISYVPGAHYTLGPSSQPLGVPSPMQHQVIGPYQEFNAVASSSSSPEDQRSPTSESQTSSSSPQVPTNPTNPPSPANSHHPSPNPYATQPLPTVLSQNSAPGELSLPLPQLRSAENTFHSAAPVWDNISTYLPNTQNSEDVVNLNIAISQAQNLPQFQQDISSFETLQGFLSSTDDMGIFNLSNIESSELLAHPQGDLEVTLAPPPPVVSYGDEFFADYDFDEFQRQTGPFLEDDSNFARGVPTFVQDDVQSLFHTPNNPELQAYTAAQQRQPSVFTQDMMRFLNLEAAEDAIEAPLTVCSDAAPTVAPQQVRLQSAEVAAAMPIFTQMTNTPIVVPHNSYVPPSGAIYSSTRRVAGSWKPPFPNPRSQMNEPVPSWAI